MFVENCKMECMYNLLNKYPQASLEGTTFQFYTDVNEEYNTLRYGVGVRLLKESRVIRLSGNDVLDFLHRVSTNALNDLKPLQKKNTLFLNEKGRFINRATLLSIDNYFLLKGSSDKENKLMNWINKYIISEDIRTQDVSDQYVIIEFLGPQSESFLTLILGDELKSLNDKNILKTSVEDIDFMLFSQNESLGLKYYQTVIEKEKAVSFINYILGNKSAFDLNLVGEDAYSIFRIETGIPIFPNEINSNTNPHEVNLLNEVNSQKGCYIGQEVVARLETYDKAQRKLMGVIFNEPLTQINVFPIYDKSGIVQGEVTSTVYSELINHYIGLALVRKKALVENIQLFIYDNKTVPIKITELPFTK